MVYAVSLIALCARSPVYALMKAHKRAIFLRSAKASQLESFFLCVNLATLFWPWSNYIFLLVRFPTLRPI
jgi:hypothetical protein